MLSVVLAMMLAPWHQEVARTSGPRVPAALLGGAAGSPVAVLMLLADAGVPSGLEIRASDPWFPAVKPEFATPREPTIPAATFVDAFNTAHSTYRGTVEDGVIVIRLVGRNAAYL